MSATATLLLDLQCDFLSAEGRLPVAADDATRVIRAANAVLAGQALSGTLPVLVANAFRASDWLGNVFRRHAAVQGTPGAALDSRISANDSVRVFAKQTASAFANADLDAYLKAHAVSKVYVLGVFAEGCVRATAVDAKRRGYEVAVALDAIGTNSAAKHRFAAWAMRRAGIQLVPKLPAIAR